MTESPQSLVHCEIKGRKVTYFLTTEDDLQNLRSNSLLGDVFSTLAALSAGGVISTLLSRATGIQLAAQTASVLQILLYVFGVATLAFVLFAGYFHYQSFVAIRRIKRSGAVTQLSSPEKPSPRVVLEQVPAPADSELEIIKAEYWTDKVRLDVTDALRCMIVNGRLETTASNDIKGDPDYGKVKMLTIQYKVAGIEVTKEFREGSKVSIP